jgi:hypothetical protein
LGGGGGGNSNNHTTPIGGNMVAVGLIKLGGAADATSLISEPDATVPADAATNTADGAIRLPLLFDDVVSAPNGVTSSPKVLDRNELELKAAAQRVRPCTMDSVIIVEFELVNNVGLRRRPWILPPQPWILPPPSRLLSARTSLPT